MNNPQYKKYRPFSGYELILSGVLECTPSPDVISRHMMMMTVNRGDCVHKAFLSVARNVHYYPKCTSFTNCEGLTRWRLTLRISTNQMKGE